MIICSFLRTPKLKICSKVAFCVIGTTLLAACSGAGSSSTEDGVEDVETSTVTTEEEPIEDSVLDQQLETLVGRFNLGNTVQTSHLPSIDDPLPRLGMQLFFSKSLGGERDTACVSCHHPALGGADGLSLPVGVGAVSPDLIGPGRSDADGIPALSRNSPTVFNVGLWDTGLFWDSRVESIGKEPGTNGELSGIRTPDSTFLTADADAGANLAAAQARFPVVDIDEMRGASFEQGSDDDTVRAHLAARIGGYGGGESELEQNDWLAQFQEAYSVTASAEDLITFENIAHALGEYERSMVFNQSPWQQYLEGETSALSDDAKEGAVLFFTPVNEGGAGCGSCHSGPLLSDGQHHTIAFPQAGPGKGDGTEDDFGRERATGDAEDRYRFRTPSLLNIAQTAPYGHAGAYGSLQEVVLHYLNPIASVNDFFNRGGLCALPQFADIDDCATLYPSSRANSDLALAKLGEEIAAGISRFEPPRIDAEQVGQVVAFLESLSDPCVQDRECLQPWIPEGTGPDGMQLNAVDIEGNPL